MPCCVLSTFEPPCLVFGQRLQPPGRGTSPSSAYEWGRFETRRREQVDAELEAVRGTLSKEITRLTDELAENSRKLAEADVLIRDLMNR